jgi:hypothetical protein
VSISLLELLQRSLVSGSSIAQIWRNILQDLCGMVGLRRSFAQHTDAALKPRISTEQRGLSKQQSKAPLPKKLSYLEGSLSHNELSSRPILGEAGAER